VVGQFLDHKIQDLHNGYYNMTLLSSMRGVNQLGISKKPYVLYDIITLNAISGNMTVTGNGTNTISAFKTSGANNWDNQINSNTPYTAPCTIEFTKQAGVTDNSLSYAMMGWNTDPNTDANYGTLDYTSYAYVQTSYIVYNNGISNNVSTGWDPTKRFYISYDLSGNIKHWNGSTLLYSASYGTGNTVYLDSSFYSVDATQTYSGFSNIRITKAVWNGDAYIYA